MGEEFAIKVSNVSKAYHRKGKPGSALWKKMFSIHKNAESFFALKNINLTINKGEIIGIIGPNGAGKSTLLKLICDVTIPTSGTIEINGKVASILEIGIGFQPELTGYENIFLSGSLYGLTKYMVKNKLLEITEMFGFPEFLYTPVKYYSSGMYMRLAFSIISHIDTEIYLFDEVLSVGDLQFKKTVFSTIQELKKKGKTVLITTHAAQSLIKLFDRVLILDSGETNFFGSPDIAIKIDYGLLTNNNKLASQEVSEINQNELLQNQNVFNADFQKKLWLTSVKIHNLKTGEFLCNDNEIIIDAVCHVGCVLKFRVGIVIKDYNDNVIASCFTEEIAAVENKEKYNVRATFPPKTFMSNFFMVDIVIVAMDSIIMSYTNALRFRLSSSDNQNLFDIFGYISPSVIFETN